MFHPANRSAAALILLLLLGALLLGACSSNKTRPAPEIQTAPVPPTPTAAPTASTAVEAAPQSAEPVSPWPILRSRLQVRDCRTSRAIQNEARRFLRNPETFQSVWQEAMPIVMWVTGEIERRNLPGEIALIPFVESRYRPLPGAGQAAAGIWQLVPRTARAHGLEVSSTYDARLDPVESTRAAMDLLEHLEREFSDWRLAYLAYNAGEFRIKRALGKGYSGNVSPQFLDKLKLSPTTHQFLNRIDALACIIQQPELHQVRDPAPTIDDMLELVELDGIVDIHLASVLGGMPVGTLRRFNPAWQEGRTAASGPRRILLPALAASQLSRSLASIPQDMRAHWKRVRIHKETRFDEFAVSQGVSGEILAIANPGARDRAVRVGDTLLVPHAGSTAHAATEERGAATHVVQQGDSLWRLARTHGVSVKQLRQWNDLQPDSILKLGMRLLIRAPEY